MPPVPSDLSSPAFLADVMLGSLAKWLRILGFDTAYDNRIQDEELVKRCLEEDRIALTRDRRLILRRALKDRHILIEGDPLSGQIRQVLKRFPQAAPEPFSRCLRCNVPLRSLEREEARARVPPYVYRTRETFKECPACHRVLWKGTHRSRILKRLEEIRLGR